LLTGLGTSWGFQVFGLCVQMWEATASVRFTVQVWKAASGVRFTSLCLLLSGSMSFAKGIGEPG
jgi:hypothetical protein